MFMRFLLLLTVLISINSTFGQSGFTEEEQLAIFTIENSLYKGRIDSARIYIQKFAKKYPVSKHGKYGAIKYSFLSDIERMSTRLDNALRWQKKALEYKDDLSNGGWYLYHKLANIYFEMKDYEMAKKYALISIAEGNNPDLLIKKKSCNYRILAYCFFVKNDYSKAEKYYQEILDFGAQDDQICEKAIIFVNLYKINRFKKDEEAARQNLDSAVLYSEHKNCQTFEYKKMVYDVRMDYAKRHNNWKEAFKLLDAKTGMEDSIAISEQIKFNSELEKKYESKFIKAKNKNLIQQNESTQKTNSLLIGIIVLVAAVLLLISFLMLVLRKRNKEIKNAKEKVERLNELHQKIFNVISHDFNGSFITLQMLLEESAEEDLNSADFRNKMKEIETYLNQSNYVLQNLTNWARIEFREELSSTAQYSVKELCQRVSQQLHFQLQNKKLTLINEIHPELQTNVPEDYLIIVFRNLINNAIKFSYPGGRIWLKNDGNTIQVIDEGTGISVDIQQQLFTGKINSRMGTNHETGFGIGLKIVSEIIAKFGGEIVVSSEPDQGSNFKVKLPKNDEKD